jgi:hypothetical protein
MNTAAATVRATPIATCGPLVVDSRNPRYFADRNGRTVLLAGSHTWATVQEAAPVDPPEPFDWAAWMEFMVAHGHNFMRLWTWENAKWGSWWDGDYYFEPLAWARTGPGLAADGKPRFDLGTFDEEWFRRLRARAADSRDHGVYVAVMLFQGWSSGPKPFESWTPDQPVAQGPNPWLGHPFAAGNNINGVDASAPGGEGNGWLHTLRDRRALELLEGYVRRVVEVVGDLDNVMYEICNEDDGTPANTAWQYHMVEFVREYQKARWGVSLPILMTAQYPNPDNDVLFASSAEAVSPFGWHGRGTDRWQDDPPAKYRGKVVISDTDHLWGVGGTADFVWRSVTRGHNVLYMDTWGYDHLEVRGPELDAGARTAMGIAVRLADRMDLGVTFPHPELSSTGFALAAPGRHYLVYQPYPWRFRIDLQDAPGSYATTWIHPETGEETVGTPLTGGQVPNVILPSERSWLLLVTRDPIGAGSERVR